MFSKKGINCIGVADPYKIDIYDIEYNIYIEYSLFVYPIKLVYSLLSIPYSLLAIPNWVATFWASEWLWDRSRTIRQRSRPLAGAMRPRHAGCQAAPQVFRQFSL